jgi:glutathione peroxidase
MLMNKTKGYFMKAILILMMLVTSAFAQEIYSIKDKTIEGKEFEMSSLKGKVVLIVNIASQCGYTSQLENLEALYQKYKARGLVVLGVPTNDFGGQTPEDDQAMKEFCTKKYKVTFPLLAKKTIQGKDKRELYKYLTEKTAKNFQAEVGWNFEKFLINKKGEVTARMRSSFEPMDSEMFSKIEAELK